MNAKRYLENYQEYENRIQNKQELIQQLRLKAEGSSVAADDVRVQSHGEQDKMASTICEYLTLENQITAFRNMQQEIVQTVDKLRGAEYDLIMKHYILGYSLKECRGKLSSSWLTKTHKSGIKQVQEILDKRYAGA